MTTLTAQLITRHPVYDDGGELFGHELLASDGGAAAGGHGQSDGRAHARALVEGMLSGPLGTLTAGTRLVLTATPALLASELATLIPAESTVIRLPRGVEVDGGLIEIVRDLRARGCLILLGGFERHDPRRSLLADCDLVGIRLPGVSSAAELPTTSMAAGLPLLAEGIDSGAAFDIARTLGCRYYQGGVFVGSKIVARGAPTGFKPLHVALLEHVSLPDLDPLVLERLIKQDVGLTYAFLRLVNGAAFGWRRQIDSISHAAVLLGQNAVRAWSTVVVMADLASDQPQQIAVTAAVRARFCELLGAEAGVGLPPLELFTLGMFSLIDALTGRSLREVLEELPLAAVIRAALLGEPNEARHLLDAVIAYEDADWTALGEALEALGAHDDRLLEHYLSAVDWAARIFDGGTFGD